MVIVFMFTYKTHGCSRMLKQENMHVHHISRFVCALYNAF